MKPAKNIKKHGIHEPSRPAGRKSVTPLQPNGKGIEIALELLEINLALKKAIRHVNPRIVR
jgi:hypothetical protein